MSAYDLYVKLLLEFSGKDYPLMVFVESYTNSKHQVCNYALVGPYSVNVETTYYGTSRLLIHPHSLFHENSNEFEVKYTSTDLLNRLLEIQTQHDLNKLEVFGKFGVYEASKLVDLRPISFLKDKALCFFRK